MSFLLPKGTSSAGKVEERRGGHMMINWCSSSLRVHCKYESVGYMT